MTGVGAIILCGGLSRRMGRSKALLPFGPERMIERVVRIASMAARPVVVVAASGQELPDLPPDVAVVRDPVAGRGPLQGIAAGLAALPPSANLAYASATDSPFLIPGWIEALARAIGPVDELAIPEFAGRLHPFAALYRTAPTLAAAEALLGSGRSRVLDLTGTLRARVVDPAKLIGIEAAGALLMNLNTPEDYAEALARAGLGGPTEAHRLLWGPGSD